MKILVVCSGNVCRSPMAAECLRQQLRRAGLHPAVVHSGGTLGIDGAPPSAEAIRAMREIGLDIAAHRSRGLRAPDLDSSDLVLVMTREHLVELEERFPRARAPRLLLRAFEHGPEVDPDPADLPDPMGEPLPFYRGQVELIERCADHVARHLAQAARRSAPPR